MNRWMAGLAAALGVAALWLTAGGSSAGTFRKEGAGGELPGKVVKLPRPPFNGATLKTGRPPRTRLVRVSERRNKITDQEAWFKANGLSLPTFDSDLGQGDRGSIPEAVPDSFSGQRLVRAIRDKGGVLAVYGPDFAGGRHLLVFDAGGAQARFAFDFTSYIQPPRVVAADREFVDETVQWADQEDGLLYVSNFHRTYAKSSGGLNGYITAIDLKTGKVRWRSRPLVCNTANFAVHKDVILTGYGFTAEPDYLYLLDRKTGAILQTIKLKSGPEYVIPKGSRVFVRAYDTDYVFRLTP
jgi:outer membrane protein assembly factor BamB